MMLYSRESSRVAVVCDLSYRRAILDSSDVDYDRLLHRFTEVCAHCGEIEHRHPVLFCGQLAAKEATGINRTT